MSQPLLSDDVVYETRVTPEVRKAYQQSRLSITRRIGIFESDGVTPWKFGETISTDELQTRLISGDITVSNSSDERRTVSLLLDNKDRRLRHDPRDGFWYDKIIKVWRGLRYNGVRSGAVKRIWFECQVGEFMIDNISGNRFPHQLSVSGRDYTKKLLLDQFAVDTAFPSGRGIDDVVRTVATVGGIRKFRLGSGGALLGANATFARTSSRWENLKAICEAANIELFFDREGYLVTRPYSDVSTAAPTYSLSLEASQANIIDFSKATSDSNIFNHIVVIGTSEEETVTGYKWISQRENTDPNSATNIDRIGRRTLTSEVDYLANQSDADQLADRLFSVNQLEDYTLSFSSVCLPWLEVGQPLQFEDPEEPDTVPIRFLFTDFGIPLGLGAMTGTGKRIVIIGRKDNPITEVNPQ